MKKEGRKEGRERNMILNRNCTPFTDTKETGPITDHTCIQQTPPVALRHGNQEITMALGPLFGKQYPSLL